VNRVSVVGNSGAGKTTFAAALAERLGAPHLELDALFHQPDWRELPSEDFRARVAAFVAAERWVVDGNYSVVRDLVWGRADTVVWLDPPRWLVMRRIIRRTLRRVVLGTELWNGNRERWTNLLRLDPDKSIIAWSWSQHHAYRRRFAAAVEDPANAGITFLRVRGVRGIAGLLNEVGLT